MLTAAKTNIAAVGRNPESAKIGGPDKTTVDSLKNPGPKRKGIRNEELANVRDRRMWVCLDVWMLLQRQVWDSTHSLTSVPPCREQACGVGTRFHWRDGRDVSARLIVQWVGGTVCSAVETLSATRQYSYRRIEVASAPSWPWLHLRDKTFAYVLRSERSFARYRHTESERQRSPARR